MNVLILINNIVLSRKVRARETPRYKFTPGTDYYENDEDF